MKNLVDFPETREDILFYSITAILVCFSGMYIFCSLK